MRLALKYWSLVTVFAFATAILANSIVFPTTGPPPSYQQGYARSAGQSAYPGSWRGMVFASVPLLGISSGSSIRDESRFKNHGTFTNTPVWTISEHGYVLDMEEDDLTDDVVFSAAPAFANIFDGGGSFFFMWKAESGGRFDIGRWIDKGDSSGVVGGWRFSNDSETQYSFRHSHATTGTRSNWNTGTTLPLDVWHTVGIGWVKGSDQPVITWFQDGQVIAATNVSTHANAPDDDTAEPIHVGNDPIETRADGLWAVLYLFNRIISFQEYALLHKNPLAPFVLRLQLFVRAPAAAGVTPLFRMLMGVGQ